MIYNAIGQLSRRILAGFFSVCFFSFVLLAGAVAAEDAQTVEARPALWQVENGASKVYLLGSFHLLPKNYKWFDGIIRSSFETADALVLEAEMTPGAMAEVQAMFVNKGFFTGEDNLKNHLDDAHYQKMLGYAKRLMGQDEAVARKVKPWFMALQLSIVSIMSSGMDPNSGVDKFLQGLAGQGNKPISGLETPVEQMAALIDHPLHVQAAMLTDTLDKLDHFKTYINSYLTAWASGDVAKINETMIEDMAKHQDIYQALLVNRNKNWMPAIESYIGSGKTTFIVVGAAHLVGQDGIVRMLRDKGYKVEKIQ